MLGAFIAQVLNGLLDGTYYLLIALGLSLIFSLGGIINLAHGAFFAIGDSPVLSTAVAEWTTPSCLGAMLATRSLIGFVSAGIAPIVVGWVIDALRAGNAGDTVVWGMAFATLGLGGLLAVFFATRLPRAA